MTTKHTPGLWEIVGQGDRYLIRDGHKTCSVAMVLMRDNDVEECRKRALLIAAAPDLLVAAKRGVMALEANGASNCEAAKELRAALAKAEGKS